MFELGTHIVALQTLAAAVSDPGGSTPGDVSRWLEDIPRYLPPVVGGLGAFIPLIIFSAVTQHFKDAAMLVFATLGIEVWLAYLITAKAAAYFNYTDWITILTLVAAFGALLGLIDYSRRFPQPVVGATRIFYLFYSLALVFISIAATNFFGFASLHLFKVTFKVDEVAAHALLEGDIKEAGNEVGDAEKKAKIREANNAYETSIDPHIAWITVTQKDKLPKYEIAPVKSLFGHTYSVAMTDSAFNNAVSFEIHTDPHSASLIRTKEQFHQDISRWAFGDVYETEL